MYTIYRFLVKIQFIVEEQETHASKELFWSKFSKLDSGE